VDVNYIIRTIYFVIMVKIHLLFCIMLLVQWSVSISIFVGHVVIVFWAQLGRLDVHIYLFVIRIYADIHGWRTNENMWTN
jgi:hypothetical protein